MKTTNWLLHELPARCEIYVWEIDNITFSLTWVLPSDLDEISTKPRHNQRQTSGNIDHNLQTCLFVFCIIISVICPMVDSVNFSENVTYVLLE